MVSHVLLEMIVGSEIEVRLPALTLTGVELEMTLSSELTSSKELLAAIACSSLSRK